MGRVQTPVVSFPPSFARTFSSRERRLGTRQALVKLSAVARYTKWIANLVPSVLSPLLYYTNFSGWYLVFFWPCWHLQISSPSADNKRGGKLLSVPDRVTFVTVTIIYSSSLPLYLAPRFWEPRDQPQPGFFLKARERTLGSRLSLQKDNKGTSFCVKGLGRVLRPTFF